MAVLPQGTVTFGIDLNLATVAAMIVIVAAMAVGFLLMRGRARTARWRH
jgi:hypothetical protein